MDNLWIRGKNTKQQLVNAMRTKVKKKLHKDKHGYWDTSDLYRAGKNPFNIEWVKYFNPVEGRDQIMFIYIDKETKKIIKHRILR